MSNDRRRQAYACDITYGTANEFGFDYLRDRITLRRLQDGQGGGTFGFAPGSQNGGSGALLQRSLQFALIDEADSILIDGARTPLIISMQSGSSGDRSGDNSTVACYRWGAHVAPKFVEDLHYTYEKDKKRVQLTTDGRKFVRALPKPPEMDTVGMTHIYEFAERAIKVDRDFVRDREYVVRGDEVVIIDEGTGRLAEGRKWRDGIHPAIEAKEGLSLASGGGAGGGGGGHAAQITLPELFSHYRHLSGMTGTARSSSREFRSVYGTRVVRIPTNRRCQRIRLPDRVYGNAIDKWDAIVAEIQQMHSAGRPVLVGTRSINRSEALSFLLSEAGIDHQVLHAKHLGREADIITQAGQPGKVTVATNMAGRGTDIRLGTGVVELGGLHVICTEMHDSARIDRQLAGRSARQGDPGSYRQFMALDDDVLAAGFGAKKAERFQQLGRQSTGPFDHLARIFRVAQHKVERKHFSERQALKRYVEQRTKRQKQMGQDPYLDTVG
jgi:preprotein translocase subunit SecA